MSTLPVGKGALDESLALDRLGSAKFSRNLDPRFAGPYGPYGGYTAVLGMKAMMDELGPSFPHCISLTTEFFMSPKADAKVEVQVTVLRRGKTFSTTSCVLSEPGNAPFAACIGTFGTLQEDGVNESPSHGHYERPNLAPPEPSQSIDGFPLFEMAGWGDGKNNGPPFTKNFEFRVEKSHFEDMKKKIQAARTAEAGHEVRRDLGLDLEMWVKMKDGRAMDCLSAGALADMLGSLNYGILFMRGGSDTPPQTAAPHNSLSYSVHFMAPPLPNSQYVRVRPLLLLRRGKHVEYEVTVWREDGAVMCVGRQIALARPMSLGASSAGKL